jgi:polyhydroxyalkanoate synthesis regulator phasin
MLEAMRKMMEATLGVMSPSKAQALARSMMKGEGKEQVSKAAQDLIEWSTRNRERLTGLVRDEVRAQLKQLGVASRDEVEALRKRVRELEKAKASSPKRVSARTTTRRSTVKQPGAKADAAAATTS